MKPTLSVFNYSIVNQTEDSVDIAIDGYIVDSPTLELYQEYWNDQTSVSYRSFREKIPANVKTINLVVNSGGGHVGDAMAIADYLNELETKGVTINREGRGIVASAATYLVMGKNSRLSENCLFMVHEVSGSAWGNVTQMENQVKAMRKFNDMIVNFYAKSTGLSNTVIGNMMKSETWLTAQEAKDKGFVKNVGPKVNLTNSLKPEQWPFTNTAMLNVYNSFFQNSNSSTMDITKVSEAITNGFNNLMEKLGLKDKLNEDSAKNAFTEFSNAVGAALKDAAAPDQEAINKLVNDAVAESMKNLANNEALKNAITDATKNTVTKEDFKKGMDDLTNALVEKIGGKTGDNKNKSGAGGGGGNGQRRNPRNRFTGAQYWDEE